MALSPQERSRRMRLNMLMAMSYAVAGRSAFTPADLFAAGEVGAWYDPSDFSTMFTDAAGTTPVTAVGDFVGLILDKSGRGNHASQSTSTSRPRLQQGADGRYYLLFDGIDDWLQTASINPGSVDKAQVFAGVRKLSDAATGVIAELSSVFSSNSGSFALLASSNIAGTFGDFYRFGSRGTGAGATSALQALASGYAAPITNIVTATGDIAGNLSTIRVNTAAGTDGTGSQGTGNFLSYPLYIGRRGGTTLPFNGNLYGLIVRFSTANLPSETITKAETWMNTRTGAY